MTLKLIAPLLLAILFLFLTEQTVLADAPEQRGESENIERRISALKGEEKEQLQPFVFTSGEKYLRINGLFELAGNLVKTEGAESASELTLATAQLQLSAGINDNIGGYVVALYEEVEDDDDTWEIDEAVIHLAHSFPELNGQIGLHGGRLYVPFSTFNSHFITSPLTQDLGETRADALYLDYLWNETVELKSCVFSRATNISGNYHTLDTFVVGIEATPAEGLNFGAGYLSDLAESDIELVQDESTYRSSIPGASAFVSASYGMVTVEAEYVGALQNFSRSLLAANEATGEAGELSGRRPRAWNLEFAVIPVESWEVALKIEQSRDFSADARRHGVVISHSFARNTSLALEYLHSDGDGSDNDPTHTTTAQLAFEF